MSCSAPLNIDTLVTSTAARKAKTATSCVLRQLARHLLTRILKYAQETHLVVADAGEIKVGGESGSGERGCCELEPTRSSLG